MLACEQNVWVYKHICERPSLPIFACAMRRNVSNKCPEMTGKDKRGVGSVAVVCSGKHVSYLIGLTQIDLTHTQKQALVLLDGTQATKESRYHDNGADGNDHVGS